jgi:hypothetical protein
MWTMPGQIEGVTAFWHVIGSSRAELSFCGSKMLATAPLS